MEETKFCRYCHSDIHVSATLCKECGRFQNWKRFISTSTSYVSLVVAIVALFGTFWSTFYEEYLKPKRSVSASFLIKFDNKLHLALKNLGTEPIYVGNFTFLYEPRDTSNNDYTIILDLENTRLISVDADPTDFFIAPNETHFLSFLFDESANDQFEYWNDYRIRISEIYNGLASFDILSVKDHKVKVLKAFNINIFEKYGEFMHQDVEAFKDGLFLKWSLGDEENNELFAELGTYRSETEYELQQLYDEQHMAKCSFSFDFNSPEGKPQKMTRRIDCASIFAEMYTSLSQ